MHTKDLYDNANYLCGIIKESMESVKQCKIALEKTK